MPRLVRKNSLGTRLNQAIYIRLSCRLAFMVSNGWATAAPTHPARKQRYHKIIQCVAVNICRCLGPISLTYTGLRTSNCTCNPITNIVSQFVRAVRHHIVLHVVSVSFPDSQKWSGDNAYTGRLRLEQFPIHNNPVL